MSHPMPGRPPSCPQDLDLERALSGEAAFQPVLAHAEGCEACTARVTWMREHHELVVPERDCLERTLGRRKGQDTEVDGPVQQRGRDVPGGHPPDVNQDLGMGRTETGDHRQQRVHGRLVGANDHPAATHLLQFAHGELRVGREGQQARGVILEQAAGLGQGAVPRRPIEQPIAELFLEPLDGLADRGLGPVEFLGGLREAALGRDCCENREVLQLHGLIITSPYRIPKVINWTILAEAGYKGYGSGGPNG